MVALDSLFENLRRHTLEQIVIKGHFAKVSDVAWIVGLKVPSRRRANVSPLPP